MTFTRWLTIVAEAFICDGLRTAIGRYGGGLSAVRVDDLAAVVLKALVDRNPQLDRCAIDEVILGCANQAGEDNRNIARMSALLSGLPQEVPGITVNRLCGSGLSAVAIAASLVKDTADIVIAGGVEGMSRAPYVMGKGERPFDRTMTLQDTTMGWRFVNPKLAELYGVEVMPATAQNIADEFDISREDQDRFAWLSQTKAARAQAAGAFDKEIVAVAYNDPVTRQDIVITSDEHPRATTLAGLAGLRPLFANGSVTAGNASGINDGAAALILASEDGASRNGLTPIARVVASAAAGVAPRIMGIGPIAATDKVLVRAGLEMSDFDVIEINEAFSSQALACMRQLGLADADARVNPLGGGIALGHPLGMSGARIVLSAARQLQRDGGRYALCTMCVGVGQGVSIVIERV